MSCPCGEGGDGREKLTVEPRTCLERKMFEEIRDFVEWVVGKLSANHQAV